MPYVLNKGELQHTRECPVCGEVIEFTILHPDNVMEYYLYADTKFCLLNMQDAHFIPQKDSK